MKARLSIITPRLPADFLNLSLALLEQQRAGKIPFLFFFIFGFRARARGALAPFFSFHFDFSPSNPSTITPRPSSKIHEAGPCF